ncbi:MAG: hypothetical protein WC867_01505 [Candidatus Pacearchaeota archaeon]|jgi:hypothetical protein
MNKRGLSMFGVTILLLIIIIIIAIFYNLTNYVIETKKPTNKTIVEDNESVPDPINITINDMNYYLPNQFAAIKVRRGYNEANITGVLITFDDDSKDSYVYQSNNYPEIAETREYIILKDELIPEVPEGWSFYNVTSIYLRFMMGSGKASRIIYNIQVNKDRISENFGEKCTLISGGDSEEYSCVPS